MDDRDDPLPAVRISENGVGPAQGVVDVIPEFGGVRIVLAGELDVYSVEHVRPVIDGERAKHPGTVVLDLSAVEFVDSHALHLFVEAHRGLAADGCDVSFVRPPDHVWRVFTLTGLDEVFVVRPET